MIPIGLFDCLQAAGQNRGAQPRIRRCAIGMTRRQVGAMLASEGLFSAVLGLGVGLVPGWLIGLILVHVINRQSFHWSMELQTPWQMLGVLAPALVLLATLTAALSGRHAMETEVVKAVREDW